MQGRDFQLARRLAGLVAVSPRHERYPRVAARPLTTQWACAWLYRAIPLSRAQRLLFCQPLGALCLGYKAAERHFQKPSDQTTDDGDIGAQADTMPEGNVLQGIVNPAFASKGGAMELQDGGESVGPGTGTSDSIPAMLSDGEFVMTAKAVRGAGGGDRREGARKMYQAMDRLEAMA